MEQTLSKALRMFVYRVLPEPSQRRNIAMTEDQDERLQLLSNYQRTKHFAWTCIYYSLA